MISKNIEHPDHYNQGDIECIDAIRSALGSALFKGFCWGNAIKYLWRWPLKGGTEDLKKCIWYINKILETEND